MQQRRLCRIANPQSYAIRDDGFKARFGERYVLLSESPGHAAAMQYASYRDVPDHMRQYFPQDHPFWLQFRSEAQLTGSACAELLGMHDAQAAALLGLPKCMHVHDACNRRWDDYNDRARFPGLPSTGLDPPGNFNAAGGKFKEAGAAGTLLEYVPRMVYREVGAIVVTPAHLQRFALTNMLTGERIAALPFKLVVSPDMDASIPAVVSDDIEDYARVPMIDVAGEIKTPTYFGVKDRSEFFGLDYYPKGWKCQPYDHPKEYYLPQTFLEMLALGRDRCLFFSYTLAEGATAWLIDMDEAYLSLMLTVLIHLHDTFAQHLKPVPTDYFLAMPPGAPPRAVYERLLDMTRDIATTAPVYMRITGTQCTAFGTAMGYLSTDTYLDFPALPAGVLHSYQRLLVYAYRLFRDWDGFAWVRQYDQLEARYGNLCRATTTPLTMFAMAALHDVLFGTLVTGRYPEAARRNDKVQARQLETAENYVADVLAVVHELYGSPPFGEPLSPVVFAANSAAAAAAQPPLTDARPCECPLDFWTSETAAIASPAMLGHARIVHDIVARRRREAGRTV